LFAQAALLGIEALAIVDRNSLAGIVRAHEAAKTTGVRLPAAACAVTGRVAPIPLHFMVGDLELGSDGDVRASERGVVAVVGDDGKVFVAACYHRVRVVRVSESTA
jgi:hypothetical protein